MPKRFMAIKIHYDHRAVLPHYLKYSKLPSAVEYDEYLDLYNKEGIGGEGFHECLNYQIPVAGNNDGYGRLRDQDGNTIRVKPR